MEGNTRVILSDSADIPILWMDGDQNGFDAYQNIDDRWGQRRFNSISSIRLRGLLEYALTPNHPNPQRLARHISGSFVELHSEFIHIEERFGLKRPMFRIPEPLRAELGITEEVMPVEEWMKAYPPSNADADTQPQ